MATINVTDETFNDTINGSDIVFVDFWADWCGPCKRFAPVYEKASEEHQDIVFAKVDTDANRGLSQAFDIQSIPTLMAFRENVLVFSQPGAMAAGGLKQVIDAVKALDMVEVHKQVAELQAQHGEN